MIYLKHAATSRAFEALSSYSLPTRNNVAGETLRANLFDHSLSQRRVYTIVISADAITTIDDILFIEAYHLSNDKYISFDNTNWTSVIGDAGDLPITYVEGVRVLPEVTFKLKTRAGNASLISGEEII